MLKLKKIFFRNNETFSDNDNEIKIHFLYAGEEYLFCYLGKETSIIHKDTNEIIYRHYVNFEKQEESEFAQVFDEAFLESLKKTKLKSFFDFSFISLVTFYDDWN